MGASDFGAIRLFLRMVAADRHPGTGLFAMKAERDVPEAGVHASDTLVYADAAPTPSQIVVWSANGGQPQVGRLGSGGRIQSADATVGSERVRGTVVAIVAKIP